MSGRRPTSAAAKQRELVLVGGGHAHVQVVRRFMMKPVADVQLTVVVDRYEAVYSGMVPGLVAGDYAHHELAIDVLPLARRAGARCIRAAATAIDPGEQRIELAGRPSIRYDLASLDVGSSVRHLALPGVREHAVATRPIGVFVREIETRIAAARRTKGLRAVVVGGGAAGVELALCLEARLRDAGCLAEITLVMASRELLPGGHAQLAKRIEVEAAARNIRILRGRRVIAVEPDAISIETADGLTTCEASDLTIWATGAAPPDLLGRSKLPLSTEGYVRVDHELAVPGCPGLFAAGDCAVPDHASWIPRAGVYAVRQGPVLEHNLRARLRGRPLRGYRAQRDFLALLNLGDGRAAGGKWGVGVSGRSVHRLKDWIDRRFVRRFQVLDPEGRPAPQFPSPESMGHEAEMECGGCAAKVGPSPLRAALARLDAPPADPSVRMGIAAADDTAVVVLPRGDVVLATLDAFRAFADDPWLVGRAAAVNAVSDVFAKGGQPLHAMALVTVPDAAPGGQTETLHQVLAGIRAGLDPLGVSLIGGHSTTGVELFVGLSITGEPMRDESVLGLDGLRDGDRLVLSKPLGTGVLLAADMRGLAPGPWIEALERGLIRDNGAAARLAVDHAVSASTDVSGFGLAGHLIEMLEASRTSADLFSEALPAYPGARPLLVDGLRSTFHDQNAVARARTLSDPTVDASSIELILDPQTSGGLLMGVAADRAADLVDALHRAGDEAAAMIGIVRAGDTAGPLIRLRVGGGAG